MSARKQATAVKEPEAPELLSRGQYSLYATPNGGAHLSYRPDGQDEDSHQEIPASIWQLLGKAMRGEKVSFSMLLKSMTGS